MGNVNGSPELI